MRVTAVELWASDLDGSAAFYRHVIGIPLAYSDPHPPEDVPHHEAMFGSFEDDSFLFFVLYAAKGRAPTTGATLGLRVDDLDAVHARAIEAGVDVRAAPHESAFGGRAASYRDPDGNVVGVSVPG